MSARIAPRLARPGLAAVAAALVLPCTQAAAAQPPGATQRALPQDPAQVSAYWTPQRMQDARPLDATQGTDPAALDTSSGSSQASQAVGRPVTIPPTYGSASVALDFEPGGETDFPDRVHGKVFFTVPHLGDAQCSGTLVSSRLKNVVITAGHCVKFQGDWSTNFVFVPGYRDGTEPYGEFAATKLLAPPAWVSDEDFSVDVGIAELNYPLETQLGARGIAFNKAPRTTYRIYGYPGLPNPPYDGERLIECDAPFNTLEPSDSHPFSTVAYPCVMRQGASGGGWVDPSGDVVGVVSHGYSDPALTGYIAGTYFGRQVKKLYNEAGGSAQCPPATQALSRARKNYRKASERAAHSSSAKARKSLRSAKRQLSKAQSRHDSVC